MSSLESSCQSGRDYMQSKRRKLLHQFLDPSANEAPTSTIFRGVSIYVNGWTQPSSSELRTLIRSHGGHYEFNLYPGAQVTHVIASNLCDAKVRSLSGKAVSVCSPKWITESISAGRQLPAQDYCLYRSDNAGQQQLSFKRETEATVSAIKAEGAADTHDHSTTIRKKEGTQNFVSEFYKHSRLHYISMWGSEMKQFVSRMVNEVQPKHCKPPYDSSLRAKGQRAIAHVDIDCFFVSVSIQDHPELKDKPVAVTHAKLPRNAGEQVPEDTNTTTSGNNCRSHIEESSTCSTIPKHLLNSMSELASCNYAARKFGIRNGMFVGEALKLCPDLVLIQYNFKQYQKISQQFYEILLQYSSEIEAISCDEAFIDLTDYVNSIGEAESLVKQFRDEVKSKTGCAVSAGISHNILLARMCTTAAKPDGQYFLAAEGIDAFMVSRSVRDLPGVGYSTASKLKELGIESCSQLAGLPLHQLQSEFGTKTGQMLYDYCRGIDSRELKLSSERKSISVDVNYGIRFSEFSEVEKFIRDLTVEVEKRAANCGVQAGSITLKMMIRRAEAPVNPRKYLGHGPCDSLSRSITLLVPTRSAEEIYRKCIHMLKQVNPVVSDIRGLGIQLTKLVSDVKAEVTRQPTLTSFKASFSKTNPMVKKWPPLPQLSVQSPDKRFVTDSTSSPGKKAATGGNSSSDRCDTAAWVEMPSASQISTEVLDELPSVLRKEILQELGNNDANKKELDSCTIAPSGQSNIECQSEFIASLRKSLKTWILHFTDGPLDCDVDIVTQHLQSLVSCNLEVVYMALKYLRRTILMLELRNWYPVFNAIVRKVQNTMEFVHESTLSHLTLIEC